jgi:hypothetical protein
VTSGDPSVPSRARLLESLQRFVAWLECQGPRSQDHHDLWCWKPGRLAKRFYHRHPLAGAAAVAPLAVLDTFVPSARRLVASPSRFPISDAHYALGFLELEAVTGDASYRDRASAHIDALAASRSPGFEEWAWGFPFAWETKLGQWERQTPLITQTVYGYDAFVAAHTRTGDARFLEIARSVVDFAAMRLPTTALGHGIDVSSYTPFDRRRVVNANAYRAYLLVDGGHRFESGEWVSAGMRNARFVLSAQRDDGSWPYATDGLDTFVDNFHTCFVLKNLVRIYGRTGDSEVLRSVLRGYAYYRSHLLDDRGEPVPFAEHRRSLHRRDLYDYAEGLHLALLLRRLDPSAEPVVARLASSLVFDWQLGDGHFVTRRHALGSNRVPYHRWAQSQAFHALTRCLAAAP